MFPGAHGFLLRAQASTARPPNDPPPKVAEPRFLATHPKSGVASLSPKMGCNARPSRLGELVSESKHKMARALLLVGAGLAIS